MEIERPDLSFTVDGKLMQMAMGTVVRGAGGFVFLTGMIGVDYKTGAFAEGLEAQTKLTWENIKRSLEKVGSSLDNVCHVFYYIVGSTPEEIRESMVPKVTRVSTEFFKEHSSLAGRPAGTAVGTTGLVVPEVLVEIQVTAAVS